MLGMMNCGGGDTPADFYAASRPSSLYNREKYLSKAKETLSYSADGRLLIDGQPIQRESPEEMWRQLLNRYIAYKMEEDLKMKSKQPRSSRIMKQWSTYFLGRTKIERTQKRRLSETYNGPQEQIFITTIKVNPNSEGATPARLKERSFTIG
ncbi:hypothetical protein AB6A40_002370 [Gnathostoma spinigerum]|uniref:Uncharacterized protein n=1 Tax=Gnathostoma spinigerum TaxID=75299 RepID=A0ABD6E8Z1_9BILA